MNKALAEKIPKTVFDVMKSTFKENRPEWLDDASTEILIIGSMAQLSYIEVAFRKYFLDNWDKDWWFHHIERRYSGRARGFLHRILGTRRVVNRNPILLSTGTFPDQRFPERIDSAVEAADYLCLMPYDLSPETYGIESKGGVMLDVISRNTIIPVHRIVMVTTAYDDQTQMDFKICKFNSP